MFFHGLIILHVCITIIYSFTYWGTPCCFQVLAIVNQVIINIHFPEFVQVHVHWVGNAIQPSHPLSSPSPPASNLSQHQGLFKWVSSSHQVAKILEFQLQHQSFQWFPSGWTGWISVQSKGLSRVFSNTTVQKHQFFGSQLSLWFSSHIHTWLLEKQ